MSKGIFLPILAVIAILTVSAGAFSLNGYINTAFNVKTSTDANSIWGPTYQNISYDSANTINRTTILNQIATVAQCRTNFVDAAAPIVASATKTSLSVTEVDQSNAKLQGDISSNTPNLEIKSDIIVFDGSMIRLYGQALGAVQNLNQTQLQSLKLQLNSSVQTLQTCTSGNVLGKGFLGFRFDFGGYWNRFLGWLHSHFGFHNR